MNISKKEIQKFAEKTASSLGFTTGDDIKYNKSFIKIDKANKKIEIRLSNYTTELRNNFTITSSHLIHSKLIDYCQVSPRYTISKARS